MRTLGFERYDKELRDWLKANGIGKAQIKEYGYGMVPASILNPYGGMDAIATWELVEPIQQELAKWPGLTELYKHIVHQVNLPLGEMEETGVLIDMDRIRTLVQMAKEHQERLVKVLQDKFCWANLNPRSPQQMAELLFGHVGLDKDGRPNPKTKDDGCPPEPDADQEH
jgi:DNA polymerase I-like protein with 3'-5' exonuclease and polymerase domains